MKQISQVLPVVFSAFLVLMPLLATPGCMSTKSESAAAESLDSLGISHRGIREANIRVAYRYGLAVEQAADSIIMLAPNQTVKANAYLWKIYCIPVIRQIYSQSDPVVSAFDGLAFSMQCREYFTTGIGKDRFGAQQRIAVDAATTIERRLVEANRQFLTTANFDSLIVTTSRWTARNPLTNHVFERASIFNEMDELLARQDYSVGSAVGRIADDVDDLSGRLSLLAAQLPREARWQGEYLMTDLALKDRLASLDTSIVVLTATLGSLEKGLRTGGLVVDIASLQPLHSDLKAALELLSAERAVVTADIERMRIATLAAAEEAANRAVSGWIDRAEVILDRMLWKIVVFVAVGFVASAVVLLYLFAGLRRQQR
jgi:hypothetical protein